MGKQIKTKQPETRSTRKALQLRPGTMKFLREDPQLGSTTQINWREKAFGRSRDSSRTFKVKQTEEEAHTKDRILQENVTRAKTCTPLPARPRFASTSQNHHTIDYEEDKYENRRNRQYYYI